MQITLTILFIIQFNVHFINVIAYLHYFLFLCFLVVADEIILKIFKFWVQYSYYILNIFSQGIL